MFMLVKHICGQNDVPYCYRIKIKSILLINVYVSKVHWGTEWYSFSLLIFILVYTS